MMLFLRGVLIGMIVCGSWVNLRAVDGPSEFTLDLPFGANQATPSWLGHPSAPLGTFATLDLPVTPPAPGASLLVTVFFQEKSGGFLRISWQDNSVPQTPGGELPGPGEVGASSVLCDNFDEGIGMSNQRSLLVSSDTIKQGGVLHFQVGDSTLGISRIKLEWLQASTGLSSPTINDVLVTPADGKTQLASELAGTPPTVSDPAWKDRIVIVPITDAALRVEQGVDFTVHTDGVPATARLSLKETGLPWGQHLVVWINDQRAGVIYPSTPALEDPGYAGSSDPYIGWREGTFFVPVTSLITGNNVLQFSTELDNAPATPTDAPALTPLALEDVVLQLDYPPGSILTSAAPTPVNTSTPPAASAAPISTTTTP